MIIEPQPIPEMIKKNSYTNLGDMFRRVGFNIVKRALQSDNFVTGSAGWRLTAEGDFEGSSGTFRGALSGGTISIGSGNSIFKADSNGIYLGNAVFASASFSVSMAGALIASSATITGVINATSGKFGTATNYWSVGATGLTAISASTDVIINYGKTDFTNVDSGFIIGYDYSASKAKVYIGDAINYLNWDGTDFVYTGQSRITLKASTMFEDLTRYPTFGSGSATIDAGLYLRAHTVPTANNYKELLMTMGPSAGILVFADTAFSSFVHMRDIDGGAGDNGNFYIGVSQTSMTVGNGTTMTATQNQYGFKVLKVDGVMTLYATNANGTETTTSVGTISEGDLMLLSAVYTGGKIKFYKNNVLVATHTTNLPSTSQTSQNIGYFFVNNANTAKFYDWVISSYNFEKFAGFA